MLIFGQLCEKRNSLKTNRFRYVLRTKCFVKRTSPLAVDSVEIVELYVGINSGHRSALISFTDLVFGCVYSQCFIYQLRDECGRA